MDIWEKEKHHAAMLEYSKMKLTWYSILLKLKNEQISSSERRSNIKLVNEIAQNISEFQTDNAYYLELFTKKPAIKS